MLKHDEKPDYNLIKLWFAFDKKDEDSVFNTKLKIKNLRLAKDILYENGSNEKLEAAKKRKKDGIVEEEEKKQSSLDVGDLDPDFAFDKDVEEKLSNDKSIEFNFSKIDQEKIRRNQVRDFILNHQNLSEFRRSHLKSESSCSAIEHANHVKSNFS